MDRRLRFAIDRGGTFTDVYCEVVDTTTQQVIKRSISKLLSVDPANYDDAPTEGIRRLLVQELGVNYPRGEKIPTTYIDSIRMGTTVATNALLERKGEPTALITTAGFGDLQLIGNQSRPLIFDLKIRRPDLLYSHVIEINERVVLIKDDMVVPEEHVIRGRSGELFFIEQALQETEVLTQLQHLYSLNIRSLAIVFLHSYTYPEHEQRVAKLAHELGFTQVSTSSDVMPMIRIVPRGGTTCVDAYLTPVLKRYLISFSKGFERELHGVRVGFMQSDGGLAAMDRFYGNRAILSGPAGGVVGYALTSQAHYNLMKKEANCEPEEVFAAIGFDMGGTSTDVSRYAGHFEHVFETVTAGVSLQAPQLDINTVAAGGGSKLYFRHGLFVVGPESVGAHPGPVCYRKGGDLAVTDANVLLGRIQPSLFPAIFGPNEDQPLDFTATHTAFTTLTDEINTYFHTDISAGIKPKLTPEDVALGFLKVANEAMARPIRNLTTMKGYDAAKHLLACFGGAGPQHCCAIARSLGMSRVFIHRYSGVLSAYGLSLADVVEERQEPFDASFLHSSSSRAEDRLNALQIQATEELIKQGFTPENITIERFLNLRYQGTDTSAMTAYDSMKSHEEVFIENYKREYGFELVGRLLLIDDLRVRAVGRQRPADTDTVSDTTADTVPDTVLSAGQAAQAAPVPQSTAQVVFEGSNNTSQSLATPVYLVSSLRPGHVISGPAIIVQDVATVVIEPACTAVMSPVGDIEITVSKLTEGVASAEAVATVAAGPDPIQLSIFAHRFMGIAEQMGRTLQRTSISVNIKERLDFSCALFDAQGGLVANAPHLPVHLGAMSEAVRHQQRYWQDDLSEGDVLVSNHPQLAGGSHLPDITVITPVFVNKQIAFFVASRGHHADVGGIAPGSMPPLSRTLNEEGAAIVAFKLVKNGTFQEEGISQLLSEARKLSDNLSDLRAQVAANQRGAQLMTGLCQEYGLSMVTAYMQHIQTCAEEAVRGMLRLFSLCEGLDTIGTVTAEDYLDDGTAIKLAVTINRDTGSAVFDFAGTGNEVFGNLNAPPAVTASAVIYCLRCLLPDAVDMPLNQGCLAPVELKIPIGSILNPSATAAVVGGNVLTSQRVTDVVLKAFRACAASQGCMNNLTFGDEAFGYYETIAGGAGAGPSWHGCSAVHTHMTNTRIGDVEIVERRFPVIVRRFGVRQGSGGGGQYHGGDGVERILEFRRPLTVSILSERRALQPYGMSGGQPAQRGVNLLTFAADGRTVSLGGKSTVTVAAGDRLTILTPGGGGWGVPSTSDKTGEVEEEKGKVALTAGSLHQYSMAQESV